MRAPIGHSDPSMREQSTVDLRPGRSRLLQEVIPWMTSVVVHGALIAIGVATATVIILPPKPPFEEQLAPAINVSRDLEPAIPKFSSESSTLKLAAEAAQDNDVGAVGFSKTSGSKLDVDAGGGEVEGAEPADVLSGRPGAFNVGPDGKTGTGNGSPNVSGDGGELARWGRPQEGGIGTAIFAPSREARRIVFICDATGTMIQKLGTLKHEIQLAIQHLKPYQSFNVIFFSDGGKYHIASRDGMIVSNADNKGQAMTFLESVVSSGTTDPTPAIEAAFRLQPDLVYFLSDGEFNNLKPYDAVIRQFDKSNVSRKARVNTILFETYDREAEQVMQRVAQEHGGSYRYVRENDL